MPITEYCDENRLDAERRLELFVTVCQAIQHAHQKGIIHRDIKPSNVMVTLHDGVPVAKVIDFGIAKATERRLTEQTLFTAYGAVDRHAGIHEPRAGRDGRAGRRHPQRHLLARRAALRAADGHDADRVERLRTAGFERDPAADPRGGPAAAERAALSTLGDRRRSWRRTEAPMPRQLARLLAGDLDWIMMKALEKDRDRRYDTPGGFADDVERYLTW